jgi:eukaryotic-like serine/threonine-protein kinase
VTRYGLQLPASEAPLPLPAIPSPDGSKLLYVGPVPGQPIETMWQLWLKSRDRYEASPVAGTQRVWNATFSPDGQWIAFVQGMNLMKVAVSGGSPTVIADSASPTQPGLAWLDDGSIVYIQVGNLALRRVSAAGGPATKVLRSSLTLFEPTPLPGSRALLYSECADVGCNHLNAMGLDLRTGTSHQVAAGVAMAQYLPTGDLLYVRDDGAAFVSPFDRSAVRLRGSPVSVLDSVASFPGFPLLAVSASGTLVVRRGAGLATAGQYGMVWVDRAGRESPIDMGGPLHIDPYGGNPGWALSPDGRRLAIGLLTQAGGNIWVKQLPDGPLSRVTLDSSPALRPRWVPGGRAISFVTVRNGHYELDEVNADGTGGERVLARHPDEVFEGAVSPDGRWVVVRVRGGLGQQGREILGIRMGDTTAVPLIVSPGFDEDAFRISPDGHWIAYESNETGRREVYVRPFPNTNAGKWQASTDGGYAPLWAPSGRELFFVDVQRRMTAVPFTPGSPPRLGERKVLFTLPSDLYLWENDYYTPFDISPDGQRFVMARQIEAAGADQAPLIVVDNWFTELKRKMAGK